MDLYREEILDHYKRPRNKGDLRDATHSAHKSNTLCGDDMTMKLIVRDGRITDVAFTGVGCVISQASASLLTEYLKGKTLEEADAVDEQRIIELLGTEPIGTRMKCAMLSVDTIRKALHDGAEGTNHETSTS